MENVGSVLFVCTGNLCRSPIAEGIFSRMVREVGALDVRIGSAGTWGIEGSEADPNAVAVCAEHGVDISGHRARRLTTEMVEEHDLIVPMEFDHVHLIQILCPESAPRIRLLSEFGCADKRLVESIPDPYGRSKRAFAKCYDTVERHVGALYEELVSGRVGA